MLIKAGDPRVLVNGRPLSVDCRIISEDNFQMAEKALHETFTARAIDGLARGAAAFRRLSAAAASLKVPL